MGYDTLSKTVSGTYNGPDENVCVDNIIKLITGKKYELELCNCEGKDKAYVYGDGGSDAGHVPLKYFKVENNGLARQQQGGK